MARLRNAGNAFAQVAATLDQLARMAIQDRYARERMVLDNSLGRDRKAFDTRVGLLPGIMEGKTNPNVLTDADWNELGLTPKTVQPTAASLLTPERDQIRTAEKLQSLPTPETLVGSARSRLGQAGYTTDLFKKQAVPTPEGLIPSSQFVHSERPEISTLLDQRNAQRDAILNAQAFDDDRALAMAKGTAYQTGMGKELAASETFPAELGRFREQKGVENTMRIDLESNLSPIMIRRAGGEAAAREAAEWLNPAITSAKLKFESDKAIQTALAGRMGEHAKNIDEAVRTVSALQPDLGKIVELSGKVNIVQGRRQVAAPVESWLQTDPLATELDSLSHSVAMRLVNSLGGNKGATSENDVAAILARLPTSTDSKDVASKKIVDFNKWIYGGIQALKNMPVGGDPMTSINTVRKAFGLAGIDPATLQPNAREQMILDLEAARTGAGQ